MLNCQLCGIEVATFIELKKHARIAHEIRIEKYDKGYQCSYCEKWLCNKEACRSHMQKVEIVYMRCDCIFVS